MIVKGTFEVTMQAEPPYEEIDGVSFGRATFDKHFTGPLEGAGKVQMLSARGSVRDSAGYVALERISGAVDGRVGTFAAVHLGLMSRGTPTLSVAIVPDSGTGELAGISGRMSIDIVDGRHHYTLDYALPR